jgi:hypothetical protein
MQTPLAAKAKAYFGRVTRHASAFYPLRSFRILNPVSARFFLLAIALLTGVVAGLRAEVPAQDPGLVRQALTIVTSTDPVERQLAMLEVTNPDLMRELVRNEKDIEVRRTAILLLTDQDELKRQAVAPWAVIREAAVMGIADEAFLLARVHAREESSPTVRSAIVGALRTQPSIAEAAQTAYYRDVREAAAKGVTDPVLSAKVMTAQEAIAAQAQAAERGDASAGLVQQALNGAFDVVCQAAAGRLQSQDDLAAVAVAAGDRDVLKIVLAKLTDPTLLGKVAAGAADTPMRLAAACKAGSRTWNDIFGEATGQSRSSTSLGDALAAVALYNEVQSAASEAVQQACLAMIRQGDESRIPEMADLLMLYGDKSLAEDYLNCGQPDLDNVGRRWGNAHGYNVGTGNGSHRANWGSGR